MSLPSPRPLPESLETPDVGVVAATGGYVAICFVAGAIAAALAVDGSAATVVGVVSTAATGGLIVGALLASRIDGLAVRIGRRRRSMAMLFVPPLCFVVATVGFLTIPALEPAAAAGTGLGAFGTLLAALAFASMGRERYARAITPDEPITTVPWLDPVHARTSVGLGIASIVVAVGTVLGGSIAAIDTGSWLLRASTSVAFVAVIFGVVFVLTGLSARSQAAGETSLLGQLRPNEPGKKVFGTRYSATPGSESKWGRPTLEVYETGLVAPGPTGRQFLPWEDVTDVRLESSRLIVDLYGRRSLRCATSVLDDPDEIYALLERHANGSLHRHRTGERSTASD
ncbi:PH domain-containing protein [Natrarchaeobaculum sulfurireducens]|uniref:Low molecular weight protein antigen 6 PH domain-containing protein n=1 Tax=Natrarchaeobaculum sulfurireducens TaxID=2044521 RepID=A0A346PLT3_9EURY|nr:PH domain-containing protein [Natrarchaeobaculum sulfurireducens]AXR80478.1 hypothetical protein AArcMg_0455 [Natrarchaeobaculum sulfurireducens]